MFNLASVVYVAHVTGRQPAILKFDYTLSIDDVFDLGIERLDNMCPCYTFMENKSMVYDHRVEKLAVNGSSYARKALGRLVKFTFCCPTQCVRAAIAMATPKWLSVWLFVCMSVCLSR